MLQSAVIEVRQHLCCANVFLKFKRSLADSKSLRITLDENKVKLQTPLCTDEIFVDQYFSILAESFSNLIVESENASFRIGIKNVHVSEKDENIKLELSQINLSEQDDASIACSNCDSILVTQQKYDRIREFPSGAIDISQFFCHHGPNYEDVLLPSVTDIFFGFLFIVLNKEIVGENIREKERHIYCRRCLRYLGETMFSGKAVKLWCNSIRFNLNDQIFKIFDSDAKSQINNLILKSIDETSLPLAEPLLKNMHFTKVLLTAFLPNRQQQYLLLHILEKNLPILRIKECARECHQNTCELKQTKAFKIFYRLIAKSEDKNDTEKDSSSPSILNYWRNNINILKMEISPFLFNALHEELNNNVNLLPEIYRVNNDDFLLSYIFC